MIEARQAARGKRNTIEHHRSRLFQASQSCDGQDFQGRKFDGRGYVQPGHSSTAIHTGGEKVGARFGDLSDVAKGSGTRGNGPRIDFQGLAQPSARREAK